MDISLFISVIYSIIALISVLILFFTLRMNKRVSENSLFNELVKQERELRINLNSIAWRMREEPKNESLKYAYETLVFNFYEYIAICVYTKIVRNNVTRRFFFNLLVSTKELFDESLLFKDGLAKKKHYSALLWLFFYWGIR